MEYLTKAYYQIFNSTFSSRYNPNPRAEFLDNEFFEELYAEKEADFIEDAREFFFLSDDTPTDAITESEAGWIDLEQKLKNEFKSSFEEDLKNIPFLFPKYILSKVEDPRVLALKVVSPKVHALIREWSYENKKIERRLYYEYKMHEKRTIDSPYNDVNADLIEKLDSILNGIISNISWDAQNLTISIDCTGIEFTPGQVWEVIFENAEITQNDVTENELPGFKIYYKEVRPVHGKCNFHFLLGPDFSDDDREDELAYLTIRASNIHFKLLKEENFIEDFEEFE